MPLVASNVAVGTTGEVSYNAAGTNLPTDSTTALNVAFLGLGYLTEAGITETVGKETTDIKAWQNGDTVRTVQSGHSVTYSFTLMETNKDTLKVVYGNYSSGDVEVKASTASSRGAWVLHVIDSGTGDLCRIVVPDGELTALEPITYNNSDATSYGCTITCFPDGSGVKAYKYYDGLPV